MFYNWIYHLAFTGRKDKMDRIVASVVIAATDMSMRREIKRVLDTFEF
jgi:hypothetical protein